MMMMMKDPWTDDDRTLALQRWSEGWTATQIGTLMHRTRNSVMGMLSRSQAPPRVKSSPLAIVARKPSPTVLVRKIVVVPPPPPVVVEMPAPPPSGSVTIAELDEDMCRWPIGGDRYCGARTPRRRTYCAKHAEEGRRR